MKRLILASVLALAAPFAHAAPPSAQQVDALMRAMDMKTMLEGAYAQLGQAMEQMSGSILPKDASEADRARLKAALQREQVLMREEMNWERLAPIYRKVYADVFSAEEVDAMTRFYTSPEGHSILAKMPQAMGRTMQEMQPIMQSMMERTMQDLRRDLIQDAKKTQE